MSLTTSWNYSSTAAATAVGALTPDSIAFASQFAKKEGAVNDLTIVNKTSPLDRQETIRFASSSVANVYTGSGLDSSVYSSNKSGVSILAQINNVLSVMDTDTKKRVDLPMSAHIVIKVPNHEVVTGEVIETLLKRLVGTLYEESGTNPRARLESLVRGAMTPAALA